MASTEDKVPNTEQQHPEGEEAEGLDLYGILGITKDATEKQINTAFKKLALKYHPDRNVGDQYAAAKFKAVNDAYHILVDPNKRRQYDLRGEKAAETDYESVDVSSLGGIGRIFGSMISRLGIPIPTQIAPDIVQTAQLICKNGGIEGGGPPLDPRVQDLTWGWGAESKVDRQTGAYYRLTVDQQHAESGFLINCRSNNKGKFKLIMFDKEGSVLHQEESMKDKNYTQATFFFTKFDTYRLGEPSLDSMQDKTVPAVFHRLESFLPCKKGVQAGQYLLCVYGDNFIGKTNFHIVAVPTKNDASEVSKLEETDDKLVELKTILSSMKNDYVQAKAAYEAILAKITTQEENLDQILLEREKMYGTLIDNSINIFNPDNNTATPAAPTPVPSSEEPQTNPSGEPSSDVPPTTGPFAFLNAHSLSVAAASAASTASNVSASAAANATAAGGWIARRFSIGIQSIVKPGTKPDGSTEGDATSNAADVGDESVNSVVSEEIPHPESVEVPVETKKEETSDLDNSI